MTEKNIMKFPEIAILVDVENISSKLLLYAISNAKRVAPIVYLVSEWEYFENGRTFKKWIAHIDKNYHNIQFVQVKRTISGKDSLDMALFEKAAQLLVEGLNCFMILSNDSYFAKVAEYIREKNPQNKIIGIGTNKAGKKLQSAYDIFLCYSPQAGLKMLPSALTSIPEPLPNSAKPAPVPVEEAGTYLVRAYNKGKKGEDNWLSLARLVSAFKLLFPNYSFPEDHPNKFRSIVKIYHEYLHHELRGNEIFVHPTEKYQNFELTPEQEEEARKTELREGILQGTINYLDNLGKVANLLGDAKLINSLKQVKTIIEKQITAKTSKKTTKKTTKKTSKKK